MVHLIKSKITYQFEHIFNIVQNDYIISILIILIDTFYLPLDMFNKNSCRMCGCNLIPTALCKICKESVKWSCDKCNIIEEVKHSDFYCTIWMSRRLGLGLEDPIGFEMIINK
jgi:hypothetical protein